MKNDFEERLKELGKIYLLSDEEKRYIKERIFKKKKKIYLPYLIFILPLLFVIIYLLNHQLSFLTPNFLIDETEIIKRIEFNIEIYLTNPLFLSQLIYYFLFLTSIILGFIFIKIKFFYKGGK